MKSASLWSTHFQRNQRTGSISLSLTLSFRRVKPMRTSSWWLSGLSSNPNLPSFICRILQVSLRSITLAFSCCLFSRWSSFLVSSFLRIGKSRRFKLWESLGWCSTWVWNWNLIILDSYGRMIAISLLKRKRKRILRGLKHLRIHKTISKTKESISILKKNSNLML